MTVELAAPAAVIARRHDAGAEAAAPIAVGDVAVERAHARESANQEHQAGERADRLPRWRIGQSGGRGAVDADRLDEGRREHGSRLSRRIGGNAVFEVKSGATAPNAENAASDGLDAQGLKPQ